MTKPDYCLSCPMKGHSTGFIADLIPLAPVAAFVLKHPYRDDLIFGEPMASKGGRQWEHEYLVPAGFRRDQVIIADVLRCFPHEGEFPVGRLRGEAIRHCSHWDAGLDAFQPTIWMSTIHPGALIKTPNQEVFLRRAMKWVKDRAEEGHRPVLLMGEEAREKYAPWLAGSMKKWQRHWWETPEGKAA